MNILLFSEQFYIVLQLIIGVFTFPLNKVGWFAGFFSLCGSFLKLKDCDQTVS